MRIFARSLMWLVLAATSVAGSGSVTASCSCQCVDGVPHTLCNSIEEARANPYACGSGPARIACPLSPAPDGAPSQYPAPAGAGNCHSVRLWDPRSMEYSVTAKVCEATAGAGSEAVPVTAPAGGP